MKLHGKVCVVTGASGGIGKELALELGRRGNKVALLSRRKTQLEELAHQIGVYGGEALALPADVRQAADVEAALTLAANKFGPLDLAIANAALNRQSRPHKISLDDLRAVIDVNLIAAAWTLNVALKLMLPQKKGHLVGIASVAAYRGLPRGAAYAASKAGLRSYLESLRLTYGPQGIKVTTVCPGFVRTPMIEGAKFPLPFRIEADDAARRIIRAIEREKSEVVFPWQMALITRLGTLTPNWLYDRLMRRLRIDEASVEA